jgi:hypothetical protein
MTAIFWLAITLCGIVGFIAFSAPDLATHQLLFCLAKWKSRRLARVKVKELNLFKLVTRLHARKRDRYIFVTMSSQIVATLAIVSAGIGVFAFVLLERADPLKRPFLLKIGFTEDMVVAFVKLIVSLGVFALLLSFSVHLFKRLLSIQRKLSNYEEYRRDIIHRWGRDEVSQIEAEL